MPFATEKMRMLRPTVYQSQQKFTRAALGLLGTFCMSAFLDRLFVSKKINPGPVLKVFQSNEGLFDVFFLETHYTFS